MRGTFNNLLREAGFEPQEVRLVRHQDARLGRITVYDLWRTEKDIFEYYQSIQQSRRSFPVGSQIASFVVDPDRQTLLVGLYDVLGRREASKNDSQEVGEYIRRLESHDRRPFYEGLLALLKEPLSEGDCIHRLESVPNLQGMKACWLLIGDPGLARSFNAPVGRTSRF